MARDWETKYGEHELIHNPGYDYRRLVNWMDEADTSDPALPFAPYLLPTIAVLSACCSIEGYINMVGQRLDRQWADFDRGRVTIRERLERIYEHVDAPLQLDQGIWQEVTGMFLMRRGVVHPRFVCDKQVRKGTIPTVFDRVREKYPPKKAKRIALAAIDRLLQDTGVEEQTLEWFSRCYSERTR
jgi:hypothetical protein